MSRDPQGSSLDAMERDVEHQRHELADTVNELHDRLDPRVRAREGVHRVQERLADPRARMAVGVTLGVVVAALVGLVVLRRRRG